MGREGGRGWESLIEEGGMGEGRDGEQREGEKERGEGWGRD